MICVYNVLTSSFKSVCRHTRVPLYTRVTFFFRCTCACNTSPSIIHPCSTRCQWKRRNVQRPQRYTRTFRRGWHAIIIDASFAHYAFWFGQTNEFIFIHAIFNDAWIFTGKTGAASFRKPQWLFDAGHHVGGKGTVLQENRHVHVWSISQYQHVFGVATISRVGGEQRQCFTGSDCTARWHVCVDF